MSQTPLSQNQVESLLRTVNETDSTHSSTASPTMRIDPAHVNTQPSITREAVDCVAPRLRPGLPAEQAAEPYDFRRPTQLNRNHVQALYILGDVVATQFGSSVAPLFGGDIQCQLANVDQCTHEDFIYALDNPSCFCVIDPKPLAGQWMLDIPSSLLFAMIDRMLGGTPFDGDLLQRAMTDIEQRLMHRVVEDFLSNVRDAWKRVAAIDPLIVKLDNHPHCLANTAKHANVVNFQFATQICSVRSEFSFAMPVDTIRHMSDQLDSNRWEEEMTQLPTDETRRVLSQQLASSPIDVVVDLARSTISTRDLLGLSVGDVITTEQPVSKPMELSVANVSKFKVRVGALQQKVAVQIESD